jgi:ribosomal-protein-alanine N-acetyltransferase
MNNLNRAFLESVNAARRSAYDTVRALYVVRVCRTPDMPTPIEIRPATRRDLRRILDIEAASFGREAWDRLIFEGALAESPDLFVVARLAGRIAAYSITSIEHGTGELLSIAVHPLCRRTGVGEALMRFTKGELKRRGVTAWRLMVRIDNEGAIGFYRRFGFVRTRTVRGYYARGVDGWRMELRNLRS